MKPEYWVIDRTDIDQTYRELANQLLLEMKINGNAVNTLDKYRRILENFLIDCPVPISNFTSEHIKTWLDNYSVNKKPATIDLVLSVIGKFLKYCHGEGYLKDVVIKKRWRPKLTTPLPKYLDQDEMAKVEMAAEKLPLRDRLLVTFLLSSGCRTNEVVNLKREHIDLETNTAWVVGKGNKPREVHFSDECGLLFEEYFANQPEHLEYVFYSKFSERLGYQRLKRYGIYRVVVRLGKQAGLNSRLFPHRLRHTFATNLLIRGAEIEFIQRELGQNDPDTTRIYARLPIGNILSEYAKVMD